MLEEKECQVGDEQHTLRVKLRLREDQLHGHLAVEETCTCWYDAPVRLFGPKGFVASGRVDAQGNFILPLPPGSGRYSLGLVLNRHGGPELQIIGSFEV